MRKRVFTATLLSILLVVLVLAGYYLYKNSVIKNNTSSVKDWIEYTNEDFKLSFKYPSDYRFKETSIDVGITAWMGIIESPRKIDYYDMKLWDDFSISVAVRRRMGLSFDGWINNECGKDMKSKNSLIIQGRQAVDYICNLGTPDDGQAILWRIIAIDNGDNYIYTLTNNAYQRNQELDAAFDRLVSTFKFTQ